MMKSPQKSGVSHAHTPTQKKLSQAERWRREGEIVGQMFFKFLRAVPLGDLHERYLSGALTKVAIVQAVRACEAERKQCTALGIARDLHIPAPTARRALEELCEYGIIKQIGNVYFSEPSYFEADSARVSSRFLSLKKAVLDAATALQMLDQTGHGD
jgi:hypothetical protein